MVIQRVVKSEVINEIRRDLVRLGVTDLARPTQTWLLQSSIAYTSVEREVLQKLVNLAMGELEPQRAKNAIVKIRALDKNLDNEPRPVAEEARSAMRELFVRTLRKGFIADAIVNYNDNQAREFKAEAKYLDLQSMIDKHSGSPWTMFSQGYNANIV